MNITKVVVFLNRSATPCIKIYLVPSLTSQKILHASNTQIIDTYIKCFACECDEIGNFEGKHDTSEVVR